MAGRKAGRGPAEGGRRGTRRGAKGSRRRASTPCRGGSPCHRAGRGGAEGRGRGRPQEGSRGGGASASTRCPRGFGPLPRRGPTTSRRGSTARGGGSPGKCKHGGLRGPRREGLRRSGLLQETA